MESQNKCQENLFCGINMPQNTEEMTDLEKKHRPTITAPQTIRKNEPFEVTVEVGKQLAHPNEPAHHIEFIELYAGHTYLSRTHFTAKTTCPTITTTLCLDHIHGKIRAFAYCNLHGMWMGEAEVSMSE